MRLKAKRHIVSPTKVLAMWLIFGVVLSIGSSAFALSSDQESLYKDTVWYDDSKQIACVSNVSADAVTVPKGSDNIETAFLFFVQQGLTPTQSAAILGNFMQESSINPEAINKDSGAYGLAQWLGSRKTSLLNFADTNNESSTSLDLQLKFTWHELMGSENGAYDSFKPVTNDISKATEIWMLQYERPGIDERVLSRRIGFAQDIYSNYGSAVAGNSSGTIATSVNCVTSPGQNTQYINGFTVYDQCDPTWKDNSFGTSTICASGCGPSAMAMIITSLLGRAVTPAETTEVANKYNIYVEGSGSSWDVTPKLAAEYNLTATHITGSIDKINLALRAGALVITSGRGSVPFTSSGHYIVIRGLTADGKWMVGDSAHESANTQEWDPQQIFNNMSTANVWAVSKEAITI